MKFIRGITFCVLLAIGFHASCMMTLGNCKLFGQTAHNSPANLYIASLSVGSGECHVVRQGDNAVLIDAGFRCTWLTAPQCVAFISAMLSHTQPTEHDWLEGEEEIDEEVQIHPIKTFLTHSHDDHTNLIKDLIDEGIIQKTQTMTDLKVRSVFYGGNKGAYDAEITALTGDSINEGHHNFVDYSVDCHRIDGAAGCAEINGHGAVVSLNFANRKFAFLGDINSHTMIALNKQFGACLKNLSTAPQNILPILRDADIVTVSHHGSLANGENMIYARMALPANKKERIFIVSAAPCSTGSATYPRIKRDLLPLIDAASGTPAIGMAPPTTKTVFNHFLTCDIEPHDPTVRAGITNPLFSTYDAPAGFVWTRIEANGCISIHDGTAFQAVLPALH